MNTLPAILITATGYGPSSPMKSGGWEAYDYCHELIIKEFVGAASGIIRHLCCLRLPLDWDHGLLFVSLAMFDWNQTLSAAVMVVFSVSFILNIPMLHMPLSEDDGNWFYQAVFWKRGVRSYKNLFNETGYFNIQWLFSKLYNIFHSNNLEFFNLLKSIWYALTAVSVFFLAQCFWHDTTLSLLSGIIYSMITAVPNTLFKLTYGEHFYVLPENLAILTIYLGLTHPNLPMIGAAGIFSAWAFQIKPTVFLFSCILSVAILFFQSPLTGFIVYWIAFIIPSLLPLVMINKYGQASSKNYLRPLFGDIINLVLALSRKIHLIIIARIMEKLLHWLEWKDEHQAYVGTHYSLSLNEQWRKFRQNFEPSAKDLRVVIFLAFIQIVTQVFTLDLMVMAVTGLLLVALITIFVQKNYYTPHLNPIWVPLSILAAKSICDTGPYLLSSGILGVIILTLLTIEVFKISRIIVNAFRWKDTRSFGFKSPWKDQTFKLARTMGEYIKEISREQDKLFVWGDHPAVYLYSQRESFDQRFLFVYAKQDIVVNQNDLLSALREHPPVFIQFFNWKVKDDWNMENLMKATCIPYTQIKSFSITNEHGHVMKSPKKVTCSFPLYRRNDVQYREILLDRVLVNMRSGSIEEARASLKCIADSFPDFDEALVRLELLDEEKAVFFSQLEQMLTYESRAEKRSVILRMMAEIQKDDELLEQAQDCYLKVLDMNPQDFRSLNGLGEILYLSGNVQDAEMFFEKARTINPYSVDSLNNLGVVYLAKGNLREAESLFSQALCIMPEHIDAYENLKQIRESQ